MIKSQWSPLLFWVGAVLVIILATVFYQPAAAKTGSLLVWTKSRVYVVDIDSLILTRVGPAEADDNIAPSPGCFGQIRASCWVAAGQNVYNVELAMADKSGSTSVLPVGAGLRWIDSAVSWAPDGIHLAYSLFDEASNQAELRIYNAVNGEVQIVATGVDPVIAPAWSAACGAGLNSDGCELAFKTKPVNIGVKEVTPRLVAINLTTGEQRGWELVAEPIFGLRWGPDDKLMYSRPKRHFRYAENHTPAYQIPSASKFASMSPDGMYAVYYQPFRLEGCQPQSTAENECLHLGVWLASQAEDAGEPRLIYDVDLSNSDQDGLNFIPIWSPTGDSFVFFQQGNLIFYDLEQHQATIWYKSLRGKLRSLPVFSPNEEAVAFVDNQGQGFSEYRLMVINPRLQPIEHIIDTKSRFRVLAWLPN